MHFTKALTSLTILALASSATIPLQPRQTPDITAIESSITSAFAQQNTNGVTAAATGDSGKASSIVQSVAQGLGLNTLQGQIVQTVADGLRAGGL
ncbi:hypothetical protein B0J14DRAFT_695978 [Halenospora varia]|nr:hypothetical protein B0J14DRAFT_695978 [Halenospora varia]